jgi:DNA-binding NarL/FixJ family response regulator
VDDALVASSLSDVLATIGCEVTGIVAAVKDALCLAESTKPDLALMHVRLAGQRNGIKGAELLQSQFGLPVILLTGEVDKETVRRAAKLTRWITRSSPQSHLHDSRAQT